MTMDASAGKEECVIIKLERENPENVACGEAKEDVDGSYVFVNNDSDDSNAVDLEIDVKSESSADQKSDESAETDQRERDPILAEVKEETTPEIEEIDEIHVSGDSSGAVSSSDSQEHDLEDENPVTLTEDSENSVQETDKGVAESLSENRSPELNATADNSLSLEVEEVDLPCNNEDSQEMERENQEKLDEEEKVISESETDATDIKINSTETPRIRENVNEQRERKIYLIRVPRFTENNLRAQMEKAQKELEEKTKNRDVIRAQIHNQKVVCTEQRKKFEDARKEERECREAVAGKRREIDSVQSMLEKLKNFRLVNDLSNKIEELQHRISHETNTLKEEKSLMKEINQLKQNRDHLSSSLASEELQEAFENREQMQTHVQTLKVELDCLRKKAQLAEGELKSAKNRSDGEHSLLRELQAEYKKADELRQEAYLFLRDLRRESYAKNRHFYSYKDDLKAAANFNAAGDKESLRLYCARQVDKIMDMWNNDDEFRKRYVEVNAPSVARRFKTLDGRSLGLDEAPVVFPAPVDRRETVDQTAPVPLTKSIPKPLISVEEKAESTVRPVLTREEVKPGRDEVKEKKSAEDEEQERKERELARREAELKREKDTAEERERLRLEQIEKAREAEDRKRKKAEKAQVRAEVKAQREAEMREKKKKAKQEKKRKKERSETGKVDLANEETEEKEDKVEKQEEPTQEVKRRRPVKPIRPIKETKSLPPSIRSKSKRKLQTWLWPVAAAIFVLSFLSIAIIQRR